MLPDIHLDQITFEEMLERARNRIASCYPQWTDFNYHDPGITLIELFAWLKEIQQYELEHIGEEHQRKYLKLLGTDVLHRRGASAFVCGDVQAPVFVPMGSRMEASGVFFETEEPQLLPGVSISCCFGLDGQKVSYLNQEQLALGHTLEFYPFGREAHPGACFYLGFSGPLPAGEPLCLTFLTGREEEPPRNPVKEDTTPLGKLSYSFWNGRGYRPFTVLRDETFGFLFDGQLIFSLPEKLCERTVDGETAYFLRICLEESQYDLPPLLGFVDIHTMKVSQRETLAAWLPGEKLSSRDRTICVSHGLCAKGDVCVFLCEEERYREIPIETCSWDQEQGKMLIQALLSEEEYGRGDFWVQVSSREDWYQKHRILGTGFGFPREAFPLEEKEVQLSSVEILVEEPENPGIFRRWERKRDFSGSGPEHCHYCVDSQAGVILFGDCIHGMAPEGRILLVSYARVLGSGGNVKAHRISRFTQEGLGEISLTNPRDAAGGREEEQVSDAFLRIRTELSRARNMVTARDYEQAVRETPGLRIESCRALIGDSGWGGPGEGQEIQLVVKPASLERRPRLKPAFVENMRNYLEPKRMLGVRLSFLSPAYVELAVYLEVTVRSQYQGAEERIEQAVEEYVTPFLKQFGGTVSYSRLYGQIDRLDCVCRVRSLSLDARGNGVGKTACGDLIFPGNGIADAIEIQCSCQAEE